MYCSQKDVENRLSVLQLAALTNDTANATTADPAVVKALISKAETEIDSVAGQIYTTPMKRALTGTVAISSSTVTGTNTLFLTELTTGDVIFDPTTNQGGVLDTITSNAAATLIYAFTTAVSGITLYRVPKAVNSIAIDFTSYFAMQRRFGQMGVSQDWKDAYKDAQTRLQGIADQAIDLGTGFDIASQELSLTSSDKLFDFNNSNSPTNIF